MKVRRVRCPKCKSLQTEVEFRFNNSCLDIYDCLGKQISQNLRVVRYHIQPYVQMKSSESIIKMSSMVYFFYCIYGANCKNIIQKSLKNAYFERN